MFFACLVLVMVIARDCIKFVIGLTLGVRSETHPQVFIKDVMCVRI